MDAPPSVFVCLCTGSVLHVCTRTGVTEPAGESTSQTAPGSPCIGEWAPVELLSVPPEGPGRLCQSPGPPSLRHGREPRGKGITPRGRPHPGRVRARVQRSAVRPGPQSVQRHKPWLLAVLPPNPRSVSSPPKSGDVCQEQGEAAGDRCSSGHTRCPGCTQVAAPNVPWSMTGGACGSQPTAPFPPGSAPNVWPVPPCHPQPQRHQGVGPRLPGHTRPASSEGRREGPPPRAPSRLGGGGRGQPAAVHSGVKGSGAQPSPTATSPVPRNHRLQTSCLCWLAASTRGTRATGRLLSQRLPGGWATQPRPHRAPWPATTLQPCARGEGLSKKQSLDVQTLGRGSRFLSGRNIPQTFTTSLTPITEARKNPSRKRHLGTHTSRHGDGGEGGDGGWGGGNVFLKTFLCHQTCSRK